MGCHGVVVAWCHNGVVAPWWCHGGGLRFLRKFSRKLWSRSGHFSTNPFPPPTPAPLFTLPSLSSFPMASAADSAAAAAAPAAPAVPADVIRGDDIERTTLYLRSIACGEDGTLTPTVGIVCGSGLSGLSQLLENPVTVPYEHIPGFPSTTGTCCAGGCPAPRFCHPRLLDDSSARILVWCGCVCVLDVLDVVCLFWLAWPALWLSLAVAWFAWRGSVVWRLVLPGACFPCYQCTATLVSSCLARSKASGSWRHAAASITMRATVLPRYARACLPRVAPP